jgi:excisionase family DNA binding protein
MTVFEAARCLGISTDTVRRRIGRGELKARKEMNGQNFTWWVELPDDTVSAVQEPKEEAPYTQEHHSEDRAAVNEAEVQALLASQAALISALQAQIEAQGVELEARRREAQEFLFLLQQFQSALPAPRDGRGWWRRWWGRD